MNLYSINYVHIGAPKIWYSIPAHHGEKLEAFVGEKYTGDACRKNMPLRHKALMIDPEILKENGIDVFKVIKF
jgi:jumonji domain-containing protein 2